MRTPVRRGPHARCASSTTSTSPPTCAHAALGAAAPRPNRRQHGQRASHARQQRRQQQQWGCGRHPQARRHVRRGGAAGERDAGGGRPKWWTGWLVWGRRQWKLRPHVWPRALVCLPAGGHSPSEKNTPLKPHPPCTSLIPASALVKLQCRALHALPPSHVRPAPCFRPCQETVQSPIDWKHAPNPLHRARTWCATRTWWWPARLGCCCPFTSQTSHTRSMSCWASSFR